MIKYIGSKRALIPGILDAIEDVPGVRTVLDLFSGTARVGHALKGRGYRVIANDHNAYAEMLARCYVVADAEDVLEDARKLIAELNAMPTGEPGYMHETFAVRSRFFLPRNAARIDTLREVIARKCLPEDLEAVILVSLMQASDKVDSTTGVQMAYLKDYAPRALRDLQMLVPDVLPRAREGRGEAHRLDALVAARSLRADVVYVDPPYNQHSYLGNYHVWESLVRWDKPATFGIACKRADVPDRTSPFNSRTRCAAALRAVLHAIDARAIVVSFNNEGYVAREDIETMLSTLWGGAVHVRIVETEYPRYVGARIGIYNPRGRKVGKVSHLTNKEYLYVATRE